MRWGIETGEQLSNLSGASQFVTGKGRVYTLIQLTPELLLWQTPGSLRIEGAGEGHRLFCQERVEMDFRL